MTVLTEEDRADCSTEFQREESRDRSPIGGTKADIRVMINALDDYMDTNAAAMNQAIPQPQRGMFTAAQKAKVLNFVVRKRYLQG